MTKGRRVNKIVSDLMDDFLIRENTGSITKTEHKRDDGTTWRSTSTMLFQHIDERKHVLGWIESQGLDPWKRGTKMPALIAEKLKQATWDQVKLAPQSGISMWD